MILRISLLALVLAAPVATFAAPEPATGDSRATVETSLGAPTIRRRLDDGTVLTKYPRGTVTYRDDRAVAFNLIPPEVRRARIEAEQKARAEAESRRAADKAALDGLLVSESYRHLSPAGKISALDSLRARHPAAETDTLRADLLATLARESAAEARLRALEKELAETRGRLDALRNTPAPVIVGKTRVVEVPADPQPGFGYTAGAVYFHKPGHGGKPGRDPLNDTPVVGTPGQVIPDNPISRFTITGPRAPSNVIPYNPVGQYTIGANPVPAKTTATKPTNKTKP